MTPVEFRFLTPTGNPISNALIEIPLTKGVIEDLYPGVVMLRLITVTTDQMGLVIVATPEALTLVNQRKAVSPA